MVRKIIKIDEEKCNGCGLCVSACHEGAIGLENGKAKLLRDDYCDGLGDCLPVCPTDAISFVEREALAYDEKAVSENLAKKDKACSHQGCPGSNAKWLKNSNEEKNNQADLCKNDISQDAVESRLTQWPVQIKLMPVNAPYFKNADILVAADCTSFAFNNFHNTFMKNRVTLIGCPKLDLTDYSEKLSEIIRLNDINSITVVKMEVPCCSGIAHAVKTAIAKSGKMLPSQVVTISVDGKIIATE